MHKRQFKKIAELVREVHTKVHLHNSEEVCELFIEGLAEICHSENHRFNPSKFFEACGLTK